MGDMSFYACGFNGFGQTNANNKDLTIIKTPIRHDALRVLYASWETTILQGVDNKLLNIWGYRDDWFDKLDGQGEHIESMFGAPNTIIGMMIETTLMCVTSKGISFQILNVRKAVYCAKLESIFVLLSNGIVQQYGLNGDIQVEQVLEGVKSMCSSNSHVLFSTDSNNMPLYGLGSNRLSQLGFDYQQSGGELLQPQAIDYFNELGTVSSMDCGSFHSAVVINGDVYTFGWNKDGRLGWGTTTQEDDDDGVIRCAVFLDKGKELEINAIKVVCGTSHTLVLDDNHTVWSCGSNKYHALGRDTVEEYDDYFRPCPLDLKMTDIVAGDWNSFFISI